MQLLRRWGSRVTAICGAGKRERCLALGAEHAIERGPDSIASLPPDFDAVLNFGSWDDDLALASHLGPHALGHATTVHPLLANFDRLGWLRGASASRRDWKTVRSTVVARAPAARYAWTVFRPDRGAFDALVSGVRASVFSLPVGLQTTFDDAAAAFAHVAAGANGRAILLPNGTASASAGSADERRETIPAG